MSSIYKKITFFILLLFCLQGAGSAQTTEHFTTAPTLIDWPGVPSWKQIAEVTIDGVVYQLENGGNGGWAFVGNGGYGNTSNIAYSTAATTNVTIKRKDSKPFNFYGVWLKYTNSTTLPYYPPPYLKVTYTGSTTAEETYGANTTVTLSKSSGVAVTSVNLNFTGLINLNLDELIVGPAAVPAPVITGNPPNRTVCLNNNTTFSITANDATSYQWQVNTGSGYGNISNGGVYSNATTRTLTVSGVTASMSGYLYRCIATGATNPQATSNGATLTVSNITATTSQNNVTSNGGSNGSASVSPAGGITPYTYSWSPSGGTAATATGLRAGTYTCTITDHIGCSITKSFTIDEPAPGMTATTSQTNIFCNGGTNGVASVNVSGGAAPYTYSWAPSGGTAATATGLAA
ncbi:MAG: hypothetical protein ACTHK0_13575, partial [Ginsengibacter sp.]